MNIVTEPQQRCRECGGENPTLIRFQMGGLFCLACIELARDMLDPYPSIPMAVDPGYRITEYKTISGPTVGGSGAAGTVHGDYECRVVDKTDEDLRG